MGSSQALARSAVQHSGEDELLDGELHPPYSSSDFPGEIAGAQQPVGNSGGLSGG